MGSFSLLEASVPYSPPRRDDGRLWAIALALSLLGNIAIFSLAALASLESSKLRQALAQSMPAVPEEESAAAVYLTPDMLQAVREEPQEKPAPPPPAPAPPEQAAPAAPPPVAAKPDFARTSEDQRGKRPDKPMFLGERDTEATSDRTPDPNAPPLPSQRGDQPRDAGDIETTESRYRDGPLEEPGSGTPAEMPAAAADPAPPPPATSPAPESAPDSKGETTEIAEKASPAAPPMADLLQGPDTVDVEVPKPTPEKSLPPQPKTPPAEETAKVTPDQTPPPTPKPQPPANQPGFRGNQRKTAIQGSISRTGRSALDVADSPLGRYQAAISRAVEQEWQRNCVRHRDFITPGFLTVRFFVEPSGKVKSVQFVGEMQTGEVQKGFTLNSIRDASIPAMPREIQGEYKDESLELIFNFYF